MTAVRLGRFADGTEMSVALDQCHVHTLRELLRIENRAVDDVSKPRQFQKPFSKSNSLARLR